MIKFATAITLGLSLLAGSALAAEEAAAPTTQQNKMKTCNADAKAKELKGDERKAFMSSCLSAKADGWSAAAQRSPPSAQAATNPESGCGRRRP